MRDSFEPTMDRAVKEVLYTREEIARKVQELGERITKDTNEVEDLLVVGILKGAVPFLADLVRAMPRPVQLDFMAVSSYGNATSSSGEVRILKDLDRSVEGRDVLIVEDIIDTGITLSYLVELFMRRGARSVKIATLLSKPSRRERPVDVNYIGFEIEDLFVVGYGLDYAGDYRNLPYIGTLREEVYSTSKE